MKFNVRIIIRVVSVLLLINGLFMLLCLPFSVYYGSEDLECILLASAITIGVGFMAFLIKKGDQGLRTKEGFLIVVVGWLVMTLFGMLPYLISGTIPNVSDAFFETMSGYSTTGASILNDIESMPKGVLFWRSLTQWIGGMGIIVLAIAILPLLGIGGMQLFVAEAPGISPDKLQPRIKETAKRLWLIYVGLTLAETILLWAGGMTFYDAINHSLTTMATGGFSTKNDSLAAFEMPYIHYVIIFFMFLAGMNFTLIYFSLKMKFKKVFSNEEFRFYLIFVSIVTLIIFSFAVANESSIERAFRNALFQVISLITTTGFVSYDYTLWGSLITVVCFLLLFAGGSAGSTAGGVKLVRHIILIKNSFLEFKRQLHPSAIVPVRFNGKVVSQEITYKILAFIMIYILVFCGGMISISILGVDFPTSLSAVATCLGNVGPGIGNVGPSNNFSSIPTLGKWILSFLMLVGRLELFTVMILFTPYFWRRF